MSQAATLDPETISPLPPQHGKFYEIVNGQSLEKPSMGMSEVLIAAVLDQLLGHFVRANRLGRVVPEMLFKINPEGNPQRRPDVAFVSYSRWPRDRKATKENAWDVIPELAIEVVSPTNTAGEVLGKIREYFQAGVVRVWVVYPTERQVYLYESPTAIEVLEVGADLDGGNLLPGFRLSLAELFEDSAEG